MLFLVGEFSRVNFLYISRDRVNQMDIIVSQSGTYTLTKLFGRGKRFTPGEPVKRRNRLDKLPYLTKTGVSNSMLQVPAVWAHERKVRGSGH